MVANYIKILVKYEIQELNNFLKDPFDFSLVQIIFSLKIFQSFKHTFIFSLGHSMT